MKKSLIGGVLTLMLILSSITAFAATFNIDTNGGQNIEDVATISDDYVNHLTSIQVSGYGENPDITWSGTGWQEGYSQDSITGGRTWENVVYKLATGNTTENLKVKFPKYLKIGNKYYDVLYEITSTASGMNSSYVARIGYGPDVRINFDTPGYIRTGQTGANAEVGWKLTIYDAGTNNIANIKNLHMRLYDLDRANYASGGYGDEAIKINGFNASKSNTWIKSEVSGRAGYKNGTFYGKEVSDNDINIYVKTGAQVSGYYGYNAYNLGATAVPAFGASFRFFSVKFNVNYVTDGKGAVSLNTEKKFADENPSGSVDTPNSGYYLDYWTVDKAVTLSDGTTIAAGSKITEAQIKKVLVNDDITFTAHHAPYLKVSYEWQGDHPNKTVPAGKSDIKKGSTYTVDTTYKTGDTVREPKDGVSGTWTFQGWDKSGNLTINENTVIKGTWTFQKDHSVTYVWDGPHPDKEVPAGQENIPHGDKYTVDTTYKIGDTVKGTKDGRKGTWTFEGWDKNGTLDMTEDKVIKGTWSFVPEYDITTEATNGTITEDETDIPEGQNRVVSYTPNEGYQLKSVTVDGEPKNIKDYPASVSFTDIHADHDVKVVFEKIPEIAIEKTADKDIFNAGDTVTYTIKVSQTVEGAEARNITVKDVLPEGLTLNKDSFKGDVTVVNAEDNSYELTIASVETESIYTYTAVTAKDIDKEELINIAEATAENVPGDSVKDDAKVKSLTPKPEIVKIVSNENPIEGEEITYTISVKEPQDGITLRNAVVTDPLPEGLKVSGDIEVSGNKGTANIADNAITVNIPSLETETVVTFKAIVTAVKGEVDNIATLTGDDAKPVTDNAIITVKEPSPKIVKSVSSEEACIGDIATYTIVASTDIPLKDAVIEDKLPKGIEYIGAEADKEAEISFSEGVITVKVKTLDEPLTIVYTAKITEEGEHVNTASLSAYNFPGGPVTDDANIVGYYPEPVLEKSASGEEFSIGDMAAYTISIGVNTGKVRDAVIEDVIPEGLSLIPESVKASSGEVKVEENRIILTKDILDSPITVTYEAKVEKEGEHINTVTLNGSNVKEPLTDDAKVTGKLPVPVLDKKVSSETAYIGESVSYTVTASSEGNLYNAVLKDEVPKGLSLIEESVECNADVEIDGNAIIVNKEVLSDEPIVLTYSAKVLKSGKFTNTAVLTGDNADELKASADVNALNPIPVIEKSVSKEDVNVDDEVSYIITARADKGVIEGAVITDKLPKGIRLDKESIDANGGKLTVNGNTIRLEIGTLDESGVTLAYSAKAVKTGEHVNTATLSGDNIDSVSDDAMVRAFEVEEVKPIDVRTNGPKTGDSTAVIPLALAIGAASIVLGTIFYRRKKETR